MKADKAIVLGKISQYINEDGKPYVNFSITDQWGIKANDYFEYKNVVLYSVNSPEVTQKKDRIRDMMRINKIEGVCDTLFFVRGDNRSVDDKTLTVEYHVFVDIQNAVKEFNIKYGYEQRVNITIDKGLFEI
jgi:hypothetical protein